MAGRTFYSLTSSGTNTFYSANMAILQNALITLELDSRINVTSYHNSQVIAGDVYYMIRVFHTGISEMSFLIMR